MCVNFPKGWEPKGFSFSIFKILSEIIEFVVEVNALFSPVLRRDRNINPELRAKPHQLCPVKQVHSVLSSWINYWLRKRLCSINKHNEVIDSLLRNVQVLQCPSQTVIVVIGKKTVGNSVGRSRPDWENCSLWIPRSPFKKGPKELIFVNLLPACLS